MQTPGDNEYYLRRGFDRFYAVGGTLFLDQRCSVSADAPTANWLIYGHNMRDGSMFGQLVRYRDEDFYKAHPTFTFDTLYEGGTWQVVAAVDTALGADALPYYTFFDADTKLDWQHRVRAITEKALYDTGVMPEYGAAADALDLRRHPPRHRRALCPAGRADRLILLLHFPAESAMKSPSALLVLSTNSSGWERQLNLISWNDHEPKYDIRDWSPDGSAWARASA